MILHGFYDNGKITIDEKHLPNIKSKIEIKILDEKTRNKEQEEYNFHFVEKGKLLVKSLQRVDFYEDRF